jgi:putative oxidoreductase
MGHPQFLRDLVLVVVRGVLAWIFIYYGAGKLFGSFHGPGIHKTAIFFSTVAHLHPGGLFAVVGGVLELGSGLVLIVGLGTRLAGLALVGDMIMAMITVTWSHGINSQSLNPGYELNLALAALALVLVVMGSGRFSLDALVARRFAAGPREFEPGDLDDVSE